MKCRGKILNKFNLHYNHILSFFAVNYIYI
uniref:Uncharacterized protein n=1 Tax=Anguilla anguilla TaxID=7936 RepID=A0A0E9RPY7_ANGAN